MEFSESDSSSSSKSNSENGPIPNQRRVGLIYDERMCKHFVPQGEYHPENPYRIRSIWNKLQSAGIHQRLFTLLSFLSLYVYMCFIRVYNCIILSNLAVLWFFKDELANMLCENL